MNVSILNVTLLPKVEVLAGRHHLSLSAMAALRKTHFLFILTPLTAYAEYYSGPNRGIREERGKGRGAAAKGRVAVAVIILKMMN